MSNLYKTNSLETSIASTKLLNFLTASSNFKNNGSLDHLYKSIIDPSPSSLVPKKQFITNKDFPRIKNYKKYI